MGGWVDGRENFAMVLTTLSDARDHGSKRARPRGLRFVPNRGPAPRGPDYFFRHQQKPVTARFTGFCW